VDDVTKNARRALIVAIVTFLIVPSVPLVGACMRPFTWLQTFAHELGHGLTSLALSGGLFTLTIYADGSGVMRPSRGAGDVGDALVSIGGLLGPACAAALIFFAARRRTLARAALLAIGAVCVTAAVIVVDNFFGRMSTGAWGLLFLFGAFKLSPSSAQLALAFVGVDIGMSVYSRGDYLFTKVAHTAAGDLPSDVANVAQRLGGPYLVWGLLIGAVSLAVVALGLFTLVRARGVRPT
jgi:hypothetical protein